MVLELHLWHLGAAVSACRALHRAIIAGLEVGFPQAEPDHIRAPVFIDHPDPAREDR